MTNYRLLIYSKYLPDNYYLCIFSNTFLTSASPNNTQQLAFFLKPSNSHVLSKQAVVIPQHAMVCKML